MGILSIRSGRLQWGRKTQSNNEHINSECSASNNWHYRRSNRSSNKFIRLIRSLKPSSIHNIRSWSSISVHPDIFWTRNDESNNYSKNNGDRKRNRYHKYIYAVITSFSILSPNAALAQGVGGVSATANPIANVSAR